MSITNRLKITISPIRLHSASSLQIPRSTARFNSLLTTVNVSHLKHHSVSSINLYGASNYNIFSNHLRIRLGRAAVCDCGTSWTFLLPFSSN